MRKVKVSPEVLDFAAAAYEFHRELTTPAPDHVMRRITREKFDAAWGAMTVEQRRMLSLWPYTAMERA